MTSWSTHLMAKCLIFPSRTICLNAISFRATAPNVKGGSWHIARLNSTITQYGGRRRQLSIEITNESDSPDPKFFDSLETLRPTRPLWDGGRMDSATHKAPGIHHSLVILFTPGFTPWFNDNKFIPRILTRISRKADLKSKERHVFQVLYACVDGIAPKINNGSFQGQRVTQGFSFLWAPRTLKRDVFSGEAVPEAPVTGSPAIVFNNNLTKRHVIVPLANTLFQTGKSSTLVYSVWVLEGGKFTESKKTDKALAYVQAFRGISGKTSLIYSFIPARPVTPFRTIETAMGNIVRSLNFGDGDIGPASRELEIAVSEISTSLGGTKVDVWALIVPPSVFNAEADKMPEPGPGYAGHWLRKGAKLCRVVSGGGGWGPKQGLLSLDPDTQWTKPTTASATEDGMDAEEEVSSMGNLAETGAFIQFLVVDNDLESPGLQWKVTPKVRNSVVFGSIPDTIDNIPEVKDKHTATSYYQRAGHFGCVSGSGIYIGPAKVPTNVVAESSTMAHAEEAPQSEEERPPSDVLESITLKKAEEDTSKASAVAESTTPKAVEEENSGASDGLESTILKDMEEETSKASDVPKSTLPKDVEEKTPESSDVLDSKLLEAGEGSELQQGPKIRKVYIEAKGIEKTKINLPYSFVYLDYETLAKEKEEKLTELFKKPQESEKPKKPTPLKIRKIRRQYAHEEFLAKKAAEQAPGSS